MPKLKVKKAARAKRRLILITLAAILVVAFAAVTVISRHKSEKSTVSTAVEVSKQRSAANFVTIKVAGREVQVNPQTGQIKPLSPQEAQQLAEGLRVMLNRSSEGLDQVRHADGSVTVDLQGRFQNVTVARVNDDGSVTRSCIDNPEAAADFFRLDPQLLGVESPANQPEKPAQRNPIR